jgi:two-component sensor histidine kinase
MRAETLGFSLIRALAAQAGGSIAYVSGAGLRAEFAFPA